MKPIMLMLTTSLVIAASGAFAQGQGDACSGKYAACMDHCSSRPQSLQASCSQSCENNTNQCYVELFGPAPRGGEASQAAAPAPAPAPDPAPDSEARDAHGEAKPKPPRR